MLTDEKTLRNGQNMPLILETGKCCTLMHNISGNYCDLCLGHKASRNGSSLKLRYYPFYETLGESGSLDRVFRHLRCALCG